VFRRDPCENPDPGYLGLQLGVIHFIQCRAGQNLLPWFEQTNRLGDRPRRIWVIAGDHHRPDPGLRSHLECRFDFRARRIDHPDKTGEDQVVLDRTGRPLVVPPRTSERPRIAVSRSRPPAFVEALAAELDAELVPMGSAGVKVMSVVRDVADAYVHAGDQYQWDNAAPVAVARAAGLHCSRVDGSPIVYNEDDTTLPDLIVCRPELADRIVEFVRAHGVD
jgi:hypothetical protein